MLKKQKIFMRVFLLFLGISIVVELLFVALGYVADNSQIVWSILAELAVDILVACLAVSFFQDARVVLEEVPAKHMIVEYALSANEVNECIIGILPIWRRWFMGNLMYDQRTKVLVGPKYLVKWYND